MSVEFNWKPKEGEPLKTAHPDHLGNLTIAREFYKKSSFPKGWNFEMTKNDSREHVLIWIWWKPPIESKLSKIAYPISTHQSTNSFITELENAYESIYAQAARYYQSINQKEYAAN